MNCPYCEREMEVGLIKSQHEVSWFPGLRKPMFAKAKFHGGSIVLSGPSVANGSDVTAWLCRGCGKVIIDCVGRKCELKR